MFYFSIKSLVHVKKKKKKKKRAFVALAKKDPKTIAHNKMKKIEEMIIEKGGALL